MYLIRLGVLLRRVNYSKIMDTPVISNPDTAYTQLSVHQRMS